MQTRGTALVIRERRPVSLGQGLAKLYKFASLGISKGHAREDAKAANLRRSVLLSTNKYLW